jgi:hypothetical protein
VSSWFTREISREEAAQFQYRLRPYLSGAPRPSLDDRISDIAVNLYDFNSDGRVALWNHPFRDQWMDRLVAVNLELGRRCEKEFRVPYLADWAFTADNVRAFKEQPHVFNASIPQSVFCKYGEYRWMRNLFERGTVHLSPASHFLNPTLDAARRDNEMSIMCFIGPQDYDLGLAPESLLKLHPERGWANIKHEKPRDHYLFCFSTSYRIRLFADFHAEACLIIKDQQVFLNRLLAAARSHLPGWHVSIGMAKYIDPYFVIGFLPAGWDIFYFKHIRYMYQHEWRLIALAPDPVADPTIALDINIGSLEDISELIVLTGRPFARQVQEPNCA